MFVFFVLMGQPLLIASENTLHFSDFFRFDHKTQISGALNINDHFFTVQSGQDATIYQIVERQDRHQTLMPFLDLTEFYLYESYLEKSNQQLSLAGLTFCDGRYYVINEARGDILRIDLEPKRMIRTLSIDQGAFPDFKNNQPYQLKGVAIDCSQKKLFVAQSHDPHKVYVIGLNSLTVEQSFAVSSTADDKNDISNLYFHEDRLYVLQKNLSRIVAFDPYKSQRFQNMTKQYFDYTPYDKLFEQAESVDKGLVGGFTIEQDSINLFYHQDDTVGVANEKGRLLGLEPTDDGLRIQLSL